MVLPEKGNHSKSSRQNLFVGPDNLRVVVLFNLGGIMEDKKEFQELLKEAAVAIAEHPSQVGTAVIQRTLRLGYGEAVKLMEHLVQAHIAAENDPVAGPKMIIMVDNAREATIRVEHYLEDLPRVPKA